MPKLLGAHYGQVISALKFMRYQRYLWDFFLLRKGKNLRGLGKPRRFKFGRRNDKSIYKITRNKKYHESEPRTTN